MPQIALNYELITQNAFQVASHFLADDDSAQEIAQLTAIEYFLNEENMKPETLHNWVYTVAKNKSLNFIKANKKKINYDPKIMGRNIQDNIQSFEQEMEFSEILSQIPNNIVNLKDRDILRHALKRGVLVAAKDLNINVHSFRTKIYRIKQEIMLYHKIQNGMKCIDPIPGTKLHHNLMNCVKKIKASLETNDFSFLTEFELDDKSRNRLEQTSIHQIVKYQLDILKNNLYEVFVFYFEPNSKINSIRFEIVVDRGSRLKIVTFPQLPKKIVKIKNKDIPIELQEKLKPGKDGLIPLSREELDEELESNVKKIEVVYNVEE